MTRTIGSFEIAVIPRSDPDKQNALEKIAGEIAQKERYFFLKALDGADLLKRKYKMTPVHKGAHYSVDEIIDSTDLTGICSFFPGREDLLNGLCTVAFERNDLIREFMVDPFTMITAKPSDDQLIQGTIISPD